MKYDIIVVGMGPSSIFLAYEIVKQNKGKKVLLIEEGKRVEERVCPIEKVGKCVKCKPFCNITSGFSGAGAFSIWRRKRVRGSRTRRRNKKNAT